MSGAIPATTIINSSTKTTTPQAVISTPGLNSLPRVGALTTQPIANSLQTPSVTQIGTEGSSLDLNSTGSESYTQTNINPQVSGLNNSELDAARKAMEDARSLYWKRR